MRNGRTYASKAEAEWAQQLELDPDIAFIQHQPRAEMSEGAGDVDYRPDFLVVANGFTSIDEVPGVLHCWYDEVKGVDTSAWRVKLQVYRKHGKIPLRIARKKGRKWTTEWVVPDGYATT